MFKNAKLLIMYGFLVWLVPFLLAFLIYQFRTSDRPLFESIIAVVLVASTVYFFNKYLQYEAVESWQEGLMIGLFWMGINIVLDSIVFIFGPIQMNMRDYATDIGLTYFIIPIVTTGYAMQKKSH